MLPSSARNGVGVLFQTGFSKLNSRPTDLCLRFKRLLAASPARLEARIDTLLSFPVGLFHRLQHAGPQAVLYGTTGRAYSLAMGHKGDAWKLSWFAPACTL